MILRIIRIKITDSVFKVGRSVILYKFKKRQVCLHPQILHLLRKEIFVLELIKHHFLRRHKRFELLLRRNYQGQTGKRLNDKERLKLKTYYYQQIFRHSTCINMKKKLQIEKQLCLMMYDASVWNIL